VIYLLAIFQGLLAIFMAIGCYFVSLAKTAAEAAAKTSAEEFAKAVAKEIHWPAELARELEKTRGVERQELRYKSYGALWKELRPLAIYDTPVIDKAAVTELSLSLSNWYFSEAGGLLLTSQARDFYFALQDLLRTISNSPHDWVAYRRKNSTGNEKELFKGILEKRKSQGAIDALEYLDNSPKNWQVEAVVHAGYWKADIRVIANDWLQLTGEERWIIMQQVASVLRTSLATDLESRTH